MTTTSFHQDPRVVRGFLCFSRIVGASMCVIGLCVVAGRWWGLAWLTTVHPGTPAITVNAAIGFACSGGALIVSRSSGWRQWLLAPFLTLIVLGIGAATLVEYIFALDLGISHGFAYSAGRPAPYRMTELVAASLVLLGGLGLLVSTRSLLWLRETLAITLLGIAMTGLASQGFTLAGMAHGLFRQVPIQATLMLLLATLGWMSATPTVGLTRVTTAATFGGAFARRVMLPALLLPVVFTFVFKLLQSWFELPDTVTFALMAVFSGGAMAWLIWWVALLLDRLERQRRESARLRTDADTDTLTGLANRRAFDDVLDGLLQGHREHDTVFSLLMLDLDKFKSYNDDYGHLAGDEVLRITGRLLNAAVRPSDLAARYGGEEFAVLLPAADLAKAGEVAQRVLAAFRGFAWPRRLVSISIGVAQSSLGDDAAALIRRADVALYEAKDTGRDRAVMAPAPSAAVVPDAG